MSRLRSRFLLGVAAVSSLALGLTACGSDSDSGSDSPKPAAATAKDAVVIGAVSNGAAKETTLTVPVNAALRAELPKSVTDSGKLTIGVSTLPSGSPPLNYIGTDQQSITGAEPDLGRLIAQVFGLKADFQNATWDNLFVGIDSGKSNVGFANITDTEQRKEKYDFASYRQDNLGFEVLKKNSLNFDGNPDSLAGKTIAVGSGTNQEKILLKWQSDLRAKGEKLTVKNFQELNSTYLALNSGKIDAYFGPNPAIAYHIAQTAGKPGETRSAGKISGAGTTLQGLICATTKKDSGLVKPLADAINLLIKDGQYGKWLDTWNLANEAVPTSEINPPGLPLSNS